MLLLQGIGTTAGSEDMPRMGQGTAVPKINTYDFECTSLTRCPEPSTLAVPTALRTYLPQGRNFLVALPRDLQVPPS